MAGVTITRAQLGEAVYQEVGLSRNESAELLEAVLAQVSDALARGPLPSRWPLTRRCATAAYKPGI